MNHNRVGKKAAGRLLDGREHNELATVSIARTKENVVDINECLGMAIQLVPLGLADFMGEKAPAKPDVIGDLRIPEGAAGATGAAAGATGATGAEKADPETGEILPNENVPANGSPPEDQLVPPVDTKQ